jgi:hypothetical protein
MNLSFNLYNKFVTLQNAIHFFKKHFLVITALGLIAAFGRVIQLGGFGEIAAWTNVLLEVLIESSRLLLFLYVLGLANIKKGMLRIKNFFSSKRPAKITVEDRRSKIKATMVIYPAEYNWVFTDCLGV